MIKDKISVIIPIIANINDALSKMTKRLDLEFFIKTWIIIYYTQTSINFPAVFIAFKYLFPFASL